MTTEAAGVAELELKVADIDYAGWESLTMVGVEGITSGRRERRHLFGILDRDKYKRRLVAMFVKDRYEADEASGVVKVAAEAGQPGRFQAILQWIIDHKEEIIAFIQMLIELFAKVPA